MDGTISNLEQYPQVKIEGRNIGEIETRYFGDMQHLRSDIYEPNTTKQFYSLDQETSSRIRQIENLFRETERSTESTPIKPLEIHQNGRVILNEGQMLHKIPGLGTKRNFSENTTIPLISQKGILASEWFGILESEGEGRFCSFFDSIKDGKITNLWGDSIFFTIDQNNPDIQKLLHLDFFRYCQIKTENPEALNDLYSIEDLTTLSFIEKLSQSGTNIYKDFPSWLAIPGGIPARYINGICLNAPQNIPDGKTNVFIHQWSQEEIQKFQSLFPNATIFNREHEVLSQPNIQPKGKV